MLLDQRLSRIAGGTLVLWAAAAGQACSVDDGQLPILKRIQLSAMLQWPTALAVCLTLQVSRCVEQTGDAA